MALADAFEEHRRVLEESAEALRAPFTDALHRARTCLAAGGKILVCGNGGSAADAQHFAAELVCRFIRERRALPSIALTTDTSALTAIANDYGFAEVFARQVEALARPGDVLIAISTSGNSPNVLRAAERARQIGCAIVSMTGCGGGKLAALADVLLAVPSATVARIQEIHGLVLHVLADELEREVSGG